jgi:hypothetical protein
VLTIDIRAVDFAINLKNNNCSVKCLSNGIAIMTYVVWWCTLLQRRSSCPNRRSRRVVVLGLPPRPTPPNGSQVDLLTVNETAQEQLLENKEKQTLCSILKIPQRHLT